MGLNGIVLINEEFIYIEGLIVFFSLLLIISHRQVKQELKKTKQELANVNKVLEETKKAFINQERLEQSFQANPMPCYIFSVQGEKIILMDSNQAAKNFEFARLKNSEKILSLQPQLSEAIQECLSTKSTIELPLVEWQVVAFCIFLTRASVMVCFQPTKQPSLETELKKRLEQQSTVATLGQLGIVSTDIYELMDKTVQLVCEILDVDYTLVLESLPNESAYLLRAGSGWQKGLVGFATIGDYPLSITTYTVSTKKPVIIEDLQIERRFKVCPLLHNHKIISGVTLTIPTQKQPLYILGIFCKQQKNFTTDDINFLQSVSHILAAAIERHKQQDRLNLLERAINATGNGIVITDALSNSNPITYVNYGFEKITGYSSEEILGFNCNFLQASDREQPVLNDLRNAINEGKECHAIIRNYRKDGSLFWNELHISPVRNNQGHLTHFIGVQTDISRRKQAEELLKLTQFCLDNAKDNVFLLTKKGEIYYVNKSVCQTLSYEREEILCLKILDIILNFPVELMQEGQKRNPVNFSTFESEHIRKDGSRFPVEISLNYLQYNNQEYYCAFVRDITERKQAEKALRESKEQLNNILKSLDDVIWSVNRKNGHVLYLNPAVETVYGRPISHFLGNTNIWLEVVHPEDRHKVEIATRLLEEKGINKDIEYRIVRPSGAIRWIRERAALRWDYNNASEVPSRIEGIITDITMRRQAEDKLRQERDLLDRITHTSVAAILVIDVKGKIIFANQRAEEILRLTKSDKNSEIYKIPEWKITDFTGNILPDEKMPFLQVLNNKQEFFDFQHKIQWRDGVCKYLSINGSPLLDPSGKITGAVFSFADITERQQMQEKLSYKVFHDNLTDLPNREFFMERLKLALEKTQDNKNYLFAVLFLDLDRFKVINDSAGHLIGDQLLIAIARTLENCCTGRDTVARFGGDEFTILLEGINHRDQAIKVAQKIHSSLQSPFYIEGYEIFTSVSIGIALSSIGYQRPEDLLRDADITLYRAKSAGRACHLVFDQIMHIQTINRLQLEIDLRRAIAKEEFLVYYQPITSLQTSELIGFEALIRWLHPERGLIPPNEFIPVAEETGLIVPIGEWILREATQQIQRWQKQFSQLKPLTISVNLSSRQLKETNLLEKIDEILALTQLDNKQLKLEITESMLIENVEIATDILKQIRERKIGLCLDDFGTGYSSLNYLHRFPVNTLKIDRSFVKRIGQKEENSAIIKAIISMAHTLKMNVIAEGIEDHSQLNFLKQVGCEQGQGYLISKPLDKKSTELLILKFLL